MGRGEAVAAAVDLAADGAADVVAAGIGVQAGFPPFVQSGLHGILRIGDQIRIAVEIRAGLAAHVLVRGAGPEPSPFEARGAWHRAKQENRDAVLIGAPGFSCSLQV
jgi:hypothetical protein